MKEEPKQIKCYCGHTTYCDCSPLKKHDGYIVPFDMPSESLKKGDILRKKAAYGDLDLFENIVVLNSSYCLPPEWVETWEKHYKEEVKQTAVEFLLDNMHYSTSTKWQDIIQQAKEMEKEQIMDAHNQGYADGYRDNRNSPIDYYNEKYGSKI
jgi:hypothetical protein